MKKLYCSVFLAIGAMIVPATAVHANAADDKPINAMCPIGKEPIVPSAGTIEYKGQTIGLCCPGCGKAFLAWEEDRRDEFVALAMRSEEPGQAHQGARDEAATSQLAEVSFSYPIDICIVSDEKLGSMGDPVTLMHDGREIKLCCNGCVNEFEAEPAKFIEKFDKAIVEAQLMHYPIDTCIVAGGKLGSMGDPVNFVYNNRLVRFCCAGCEPGFKDDPAKYFRALDTKIIEQQTKTYPADHMRRGRSRTRFDGRSDRLRLRQSPRPLLLCELHQEVRSGARQVHGQDRQGVRRCPASVISVGHLRRCWR